MRERASCFRRLRRLAGLALAMPALVPPALPAQPAAAREAVVVLPPFLVEEQVKALPWAYYAGPGLEVLASCDPVLATFVVERTIQLDRMIPAFIPVRFLATTAAPEILILVDEEVAQNQAREVLAAATQRSDVVFMPNLRLVDA